MKKVNYSRFINCVSAARKESPIRETTALTLNHPDILSLAPGWPNPSLFPFQSAQFTTDDGVNLSFSGEDMKKVLQYNNSQGINKLVQWVKKLHKKYHNPPYLSTSDNAEHVFEVCITSGSQDGLNKTFEMLAKPGDTILFDNPSYAGTLAMLRPYGFNFVPVDTDKYGMRSDSLLKIMERWTTNDCQNPNSDIPKIIYTIPTCSNPTGATASLQRKKEIYQIARKYEMVILEDDPYFFLKFGESIPSYQSLDVDGRVIRSDSMSKVMSAGLRLGWISGAKPFIERIILHQQTTVIHCNTLGQFMVANLLDEWGLEGFDTHIKRVQAFYECQRDAMVRCLNRRLQGLAEWNVPEGGMFVWIKVLGVKDTTAMIKKRALDKKVLLLPGSVFEVVEGKPSSYCRASYSFASEEVMDEAFRRLAELIVEERESSENDFIPA